MNARLVHGSICLALTLLTLGAMGRVTWLDGEGPRLALIGHDFINLDDGLYVIKNPAVTQGLRWPGFVWAWTTHHAGYWIPLTWMSLQMDASLFWPSDVLSEVNAASQAAWGFHLTNLVLHCVDVLLFYVLLVRLTGLAGRSAVAAALFAVHPLHVESVAWITERKDVLSTLFLLLTLLAYHRYVETRSWGHYSLTLLLFFLGLSAKPILVTLPCLLLLLDYWPLGRFRMGTNLPDRGEGKMSFSLTLKVGEKAIYVGRLLGEKVPFFLMSLAYGVLTLLTQYRAGAVATSLTLEERLATALQGYGWYLQKTFLPTNLGLVYPHQVVPLSSAAALVPLLILALISVAAILLVRKQPALIVGWLWFLGTLLPVSGLVQSGDQGMADRFVYVPHLGLLWAMVWVVADAFDGLRIPRSVQLVPALAVVGWFSYLTWIQVSYWHNTETIMRHSVLVDERNHRAFECWAGYLLEKKDFPGALTMADRALRIKESPRYHWLKAQAYDKLGYGAEKMAEMRKAAELWKKHIDVEYADPAIYCQLGQALYAAGDVEAAVENLQKSLAMNDNQWDAHFTLGLVLLGGNQIEQAEIHLARAFRLNPSSHQTADRLGVALGRQGKWSQARDYFEKAVVLRPEKDGVYYRANLAFALGKLDRPSDAQNAYGQVLAVFPEWPLVASIQAVKLATNDNPGLRDLGEALELAQQACAATGNLNADLLENQAMVFAAAGLFPQAIASAGQALKLVADEERRQRLRDRISAYQKKAGEK